MCIHACVHAAPALTVVLPFVAASVARLQVTMTVAGKVEDFTKAKLTEIRADLAKRLALPTGTVLLHRVLPCTAAGSRSVVVQ